MTAAFVIWEGAAVVDEDGAGGVVVGVIMAVVFNTTGGDVKVEVSGGEVKVEVSGTGIVE